MDLNGKNIAIIIAHPDDETIGCGGFIQKAVSEGAICKVVLPIRRVDPRGVANWDLLLLQFNKACKLLGAEPVYLEDSIEDLTADIQIQKLWSLINPYVEWADIVMCHWHGDMHQAHQAVSKAVEFATRPFRNLKTVLAFEIPTSTDQAFQYTFSPNCFVKLTKQHTDLKISAMSIYTTELIAGRTPYNLENYLKIRGNQIGQEYAEAFVIQRYFI